MSCSCRTVQRGKPCQHSTTTW
ncbi:hypothetical protein ACIBG0_21855 [Nocardia sp. NPDC050630]